MLKLIMQIRGKIPQKLIKRGQFSTLYFNDQGDFLSHEVDPFTKKDYIKEMNVNNYPTKDLLTLLKNNSNISEETQLNSFKDFLEKCLHLDPNKRINPLEVLTHEFIGIMPTLKK